MHSSDTIISLRRTGMLLAVLTFLAVLLSLNFSWLFSQEVDAAQLQTRSVALSSTLGGNETTGVANSETNGSDASHTFSFNPATDGSISSVKFEYCTNAIGACTAPGVPTTGEIDVDTGTAITTQTSGGTPFSNAYSIDGVGSNDCAASSNVICITSSGNVLDDAQQVIFTFDDIRNPDYVTPTSQDDNTFFVHITTYSDSAWSTSVDDGTVASAITVGITITAKVVETLGFSTTADITAVPAEGPGTCVSLTGSGAIALGDPVDGVLSLSQAYDAYSAFRLYTNSANGTVVQYRGSTLTKGTDDIDAIGGTAAQSSVQTEQFGLAINITDPPGSITGANGGFGGAGQLTIGAQYDKGDGDINTPLTDPAEFAFVANTLTPIADSTSGSSTNYVACDTAAVRYIGNISALTPAGTYTTTIVFYAVPTY